MTASKNAADVVRLSRSLRRAPPRARRKKQRWLQLGELSELLGYVLKRAQLKVFEDFLRCVAPLQG